MGLCSLCDGLDLRNLTDNGNEVQDIIHQKSLLALKQSAPSCALCRLFFDQLSDKLAHQNFDDSVWSDSPIVLRGRQHLDEDYYPQGIYALKVRCDRAKVYAVFGLYPDEEDSNVPPEGIIIGGGIKPPEDRADLLREWIQTCNMSHQNCSDLANQLPTRIVDVGEDGIREPYLKISSPGETAHYIALSHCWGSNPTAVVRTTTATIGCHKQQLPLSTLPKTFRDAIAITRSLGIQFLWIDSLCIIQDEPADWERESAVMCAVYSQAYLTIAASASKDSSGGCFLPRPRGKHVRVKCSLSPTRGGNSNMYGNGGANAGPRYSRVFIRPQPLNFDDLDHSHLNTRAWVAQERLLSPRTVHYGADQLFWECRTTRAAEDGVPVSADTQQRLLWDGRLHLFPSSGPHTRSDASLARLVWDWYHMVENYSARGLTKAGDKLPAISGIAALVSTRIAYTLWGTEAVDPMAMTTLYVAGLWSCHFPYGLLWHRRGPEWLARPQLAEGYRAPSWSWAAWDGEVAMPSSADIESSSNPALSTADEIRAAVTPLGLDPRGKLAAGFVQLTARLKAADPREDPAAEAYQLYGSEVTKEHLRDRGESIGWAIFDDAYCPGAGPVYCLQLTVKQYPVLQLCYALLLEPTGRENEFRRVGFGGTGGGEPRTGWFEGAEKVRITVI
jgi:Heterokaryon incompatibility protein (HET)